MSLSRRSVLVMVDKVQGMLALTRGHRPGRGCTTTMSPAPMDLVRVQVHLPTR
jgi:hypothetical protein